MFFMLICVICSTGTQHLSSVVGQWKYTDRPLGCKNFTMTSLSLTETTSTISFHHSFSNRQLIQLPIGTSLMGILFPFLWMESGCKIGSPWYSWKKQVIFWCNNNKMSKCLVLFWIWKIYILALFYFFYFFFVNIKACWPFYFRNSIKK